MPISSKLSHVDGVQAALLDIERRRLSTSDMYRHGLMSMAGKLDALRTHLTEEPGVKGTYIVPDLESLLSKVSSAMNAVTPRTHGGLGSRSIEDSDLKLVAYGILRDGIAQMYRDHHGENHSGQCLICLCLHGCASTIGAIERVLSARMATAKAEAKTLHGGQKSHRATPVAATVNGAQSWIVTCPSCGPIDVFPINQAHVAATTAVRHRRGATALPLTAQKAR